MRISQNTFLNTPLIFGLVGFSLLMSWAIVSNLHYVLVASGFVLLTLFIIKFEVIFPLLLIARSSLDIFTDIGFYVGPMKLNIPAFVSMFISAVGLFYLGSIFISERDKKTVFDDISKSFSIWLLALLFWVFWAYHQFGTEGLIGLREWVRLFSLFVIYLLSVQLVRLKGYDYLINWAMISLFIPLSVACFQMFFYHDRLISGSCRVYGTLAHPNVFSLYLVLFVAITLWKLKFSRMKLPWIGLLIIILTILINTFSLTGMVMISVFFLIIVIIEFEMKLRITIFSLFLLLVISFSYTDTGQQRMAELRNMPSIVEVVEEEVFTNSFTWRIVNWKLLFEQWTKKPVLGFGLGMHGLINPWRNCAAHNDYLRFLVELGIVGFAIYIWFIARVGMTLMRQWHFYTDTSHKYLALLMGAVFISLMIGSTVGNFNTATTFQFYFWALLSCVMIKEPDKEHDQQSTSSDTLSH